MVGLRPGFVLIALVLFATSSSTRASEGRATKEMPGVPLFTEEARAVLACPAGIPWRCDPARLRRFNAVLRITIDAPSDVDARAALPRDLDITKQQCPTSLAIAVTGKSDLWVDWSHVTFVDGGIATQAVPGRTKVIAANLVQRGSAAPAGSTLLEDVVPIEGQCAGKALLSGTPVLLNMPLRVGGREDRVVFSVHVEPVSRSEAEVFAMLAEPPAAVLTNRPAVLDSAPITGASIGGVLGFGLGAGAGAISGLLMVGSQPSSDIARNQGLFWANVGAGAVLVGTGLGAAGYFVGRSSVGVEESMWERRQETVDRANALIAEWHRRRVELGLEPSANPAPVVTTYVSP